MKARSIRKAPQGERILTCTYETTGKSYGLDNDVPVPKKMGCFLASHRRGERWADRPHSSRRAAFANGSRYGLLPYCFHDATRWKQRKIAIKSPAKAAAYLARQSE
jgi:hypothetical protein